MNARAGNGSRALRYAYMDHWRVDTRSRARCRSTPRSSASDTFLRQVAAVGFEATETFDFHLGVMRELFGSLEECRAHSCRPAESRARVEPVPWRRVRRAPERAARPATHDRMFGYAEASCERSRPRVSGSRT